MVAGFFFFHNAGDVPPDAGASTGNDDDLVGFFCHDFPPEKVELIQG